MQTNQAVDTDIQRRKDEITSKRSTHMLTIQLLILIAYSNYFHKISHITEPNSVLICAVSDSLLITILAY